MRTLHLHPPSLLAGCGLALLVMTTLAQKPATPATPSFEFKVVDDPEDDDIAKLAREGWDFAGYMGQGVKGSGNDQTIWRRPSK